MSISVEATGKYYTTQTTDFHFANYKFSFRKLQIFISFRSISFRFVSLHFVSQTTLSRSNVPSTQWKSIRYKTQSVSLTLIH